MYSNEESFDPQYEDDFVDPVDDEERAATMSLLGDILGFEGFN